MGKLIYSTNVSHDGYIEDSQGEMLTLIEQHRFDDGAVFLR